MAARKPLILNGGRNRELAAADTLTAASLPVMVGATGGSAGTSGAVPSPVAGDQTKYLAGSGTWVDLALTGDVTSAGQVTTLTNAPVIAKVLTGFTSGSGTVSASDSILQAMQKIDGNTKGIPQNSQSAAYTLVLADAGKHLLHPATDNNARTFTIPANSSVAFPIGTTIFFVNEINTVTIAITTDTLTFANDNTTGSRTLAAGGVATAIKITATKWIISGAGVY